MCQTHKHLGSRTDNEIVVPTSTTGALAQKSEKSDPRIEDHSSRALPDRSAKIRSDIADSLGDSDGMDGMDIPAINQTTVDFAVARLNNTNPTTPSIPKAEPRSDRGSGSDRKKDDPRGSDQRPSKPAKQDKTPPPAPKAPAARVEPPKPATSAPVSATKPAAQKPVATEKKELGAPEIQKIRSAIETGLSNYRGIAAFKTQNRRSARERTLDAIFSAAGETPRAGDRFAAAKRLAKLAGGEELLQMVNDLHKN